MLNKLDIRRIDSAIKFIESGAFKHVGENTSDDIVTILAVLYDYRRELMSPERKQRVISQ
ncbi:MAG: hypothetical protein J6W09_04310 [Bacteroidales bacterium]|nr:hypothetical protein [Bacteroidales bacterium]